MSAFGIPLRAILVAVSVSFVAGCSWTINALRSAEISSSPDLDCIREEIAAMPGIVEVSEWTRSSGGRQLTLRGVMPPDNISSLRYTEKDGFIGYLTFTDRGADKREYLIQQAFPLENVTSKNSATCTQADLDHAVSLMRRVDEKIAAQCGASVVKETQQESLPKTRRCPLIGAQDYAKQK